MKRSSIAKSIGAAFIMLASVTLFQSCLNNESHQYVNAIVTVKPLDGNKAFYMQLDDSTTLWPDNLAKSPFGDKEVRALVIYEVLDSAKDGYDQSVLLSSIDSVLTKKTVVTMGDKEADNAKYGNDPVEIVNDFTTVVEDGYLTLRFRVEMGMGNTTHLMNLVTGTNPENPYEVVFHHKIENGDMASGMYPPMYGDGIVAFRLNSLPDTKGEKVKLTVKWNSFQGEKSHDFTYCTRPSDREENAQ